MNNIESLKSDYLSNNYNQADLLAKYKISNRDIINLYNKHKWTKGSGNYKRNVKLIKRTYLLNTEFFKVIDSSEKSYILGFLYADGYNDQKNGKIQLTLQEQDVDILIKILKCLDSNCEIKYFTKNVNNIERKYVRVIICNKIISQDLVTLGCFQKKSLTLKFPTEEQVPREFISHFIRGYFDGDGGYYFYKNLNKFNFSVVGSKDFIDGLQKQLINALNFTPIKIKKDIKSDGIGIYSKSGRKNLMSFADYIYSNATIFLNRKYNQFIENTK